MTVGGFSKGMRRFKDAISLNTAAKARVVHPEENDDCGFRFAEGVSWKQFEELREALGKSSRFWELIKGRISVIGNLTPTQEMVQ